MPSPGTIPPKTKITMKDVARHAGVSQSTVSRVLSGNDTGIPIGDETRQRVQEAVRELGYLPNLHAGSLRGQKTRMIAMMIADIANPFYHAMVRAAQDVARSHHYDVMIANSDHQRENELLFIESIIRRPVDGAFIVRYHLTTEDMDELIDRTGTAIVAVGQHVTHPAVDTVFSNDYQAVVDLVTWLYRERGHRRIGFIGVTSSHSAGVRRRAAFLAAMRTTGLPLAPELFQLGDWSTASGERAMRALLSLSHPPTAVFALNDLMAIGAMEAANALGLRIPADVAIVGFDDIPAASWVRPQLTTVAQHPAEMGHILAEALFARIAGLELGPPRHFEVACDLILRASA